MCSPAQTEGEVKGFQTEEHMNADIHVAQPITRCNGDFVVVCLGSMLGLALTGLVCALGFGIEIGQALIIAG